jgi:arylsulfatase A-like enzyme
MTDDQGWGDTGYNGHPHLKTPHLDQMCRDGLRFDRWYAAAPVCSPTRGSCLTGRHPYRYGIPSANKGHIKSDEITLAELLHHHGYVTGHFGKWHLGTLTKTLKESNRGGPRGSMRNWSGGLRGRKRSLLEGGVRVPGILVWPDRVKPGSVTQVPCATIDYLPTILEALGNDCPTCDRWTA